MISASHNRHNVNSPLPPVNQHSGARSAHTPQKGSNTRFFNNKRLMKLIALTAIMMPSARTEAHNAHNRLAVSNPNTNQRLLQSTESPSPQPTLSPTAAPTENCSYQNMSTDQLMDFIFSENRTVTQKDIRQDLFYSVFAKHPLPVTLEPRNGLFNKQGDFSSFLDGFPNRLEPNEVEILRDAIKYWNNAFNREVMQLVEGPIKDDQGILVQHCGDRESFYESGKEAYAHPPFPINSLGGIVCLNPRSDEIADPMRLVAHELGHAAFGLKHTIEKAEEGARSVISDAWSFPTDQHFQEFRGMSTVMAYRTDESKRGNHKFNVDCPGPVDVLLSRIHDDIKNPFVRVAPQESCTMRSDKSFYPFDRFLSSATDGITIGLANGLIKGTIKHLNNHGYMHHRIPLKMLTNLCFAMSIMAAYGIKAGGIAAGIAAVRQLLAPNKAQSGENGQRSESSSNVHNTHNNAANEVQPDQEASSGQSSRLDKCRNIAKDVFLSKYFSTSLLKDLTRYLSANPNSAVFGILAIGGESSGEAITDKIEKRLTGVSGNQNVQNGIEIEMGDGAQVESVTEQGLERGINP